MTGPKAVLQASQNDESFTDSIEDLIDEYLELIFPSEDTSETMQLIELMTSRDPDSKIRAIVATEGGIQDFLIKLDKKPCMHLVEISIFLLNHVIVRPTNIIKDLCKAST